MRFTPLSDEQVAAEKAKFGPWPNGIYDFEVNEADDGVSKAGNDMIILDLTIFGRDGARRTMKAYLLEQMPVVLRHACEAVGCHVQYASGDITPHMFIGRTGKLRLGLERRDGQDDRNKIIDYIPAEPVLPLAAARNPAWTAPSRSKEKVSAKDLDDEIPF